MPTTSTVLYAFDMEWSASITLLLLEKMDGVEDRLSEFSLRCWLPLELFSLQ